MSQEKRVMKILTEILMKYKSEISTSISDRKRIEFGTIVSATVDRIQCHNGAGGKTYIIQADFQATLDSVKGGIVVKFADDLNAEIENATMLRKLLKKRQKEFEARTTRIPTFYPEEVYSPEILGVYDQASCVIFEYISDCVSLIEAPLTFENKLKILGYALGRLHGAQMKEPAIKLYRPMFTYLEKTGISPEHLKFWQDTITFSKGGAEFLHGDSHLENVLLSGRQALAWLDSLMIPMTDRMDDIGYSISHIIQVEVAAAAEKEGGMTQEWLNNLIEKINNIIIPITISSYKLTCDLSGAYTGEIPIDFFLGAHLVVRAKLWEKNISEMLTTLGKYYIEEHPFNKLLQSS